MVSRERRRAASSSPGAGRQRAGEAGYNLVILMVAITVLNILVAMALPLWRTAIQRDKEEDLIFRGWQYAEAIRVFQHRFGRLPVRLEELVEVKPRCIRQLWEDPITGKRDWVPIIVGAPDGTRIQQPLPGVDNGTGGADGGEGSGTAEGEGGAPGAGGGTKPGDTTGTGTANGAPNGGTVTVGPIRGVHSRSTLKAIKRLFDQDHYDRWQFTVDLLGATGQAAPGAAVPSQPVLRARWLGRPFRPGLSPGGMPPPPTGTPLPGATPGTHGIPGGSGQPKPEPPLPDDNGAPNGSGGRHDGAR